ncbi:hypothetical protein [Corynebacterium freiburgense]|uniref:hypothetical protein n=1 Tax=Corynebacterium freiburgense TaxID=556548 RepID=UPI000405EEA3|nr:hypothetical protein [Corynebacterium freiburgense]WJZ02152.1 hypothetical protein CFREI_04270 [Corynebacterium freiburgense]
MSLDDCVKGTVDLPRDEFERRFHRLCAMVNADDALRMYLMVLRKLEEFFVMANASPWLEEARASDRTPDPFLEFFGIPTARFGVFDVVKPVGEVFLIEDIFSKGRFGNFVLVVTDEPGFPEGVWQMFSGYIVNEVGIGEIYERYLRGGRSFVYAPGNIDVYNVNDHEYGVFFTYSEEFAEIFPDAESDKW